MQPFERLRQLFVRNLRTVNRDQLVLWHPPPSGRRRSAASLHIINIVRLRDESGAVIAYQVARLESSRRDAGHGETLAERFDLAAHARDHRLVAATLQDIEDPAGDRTHLARAHTARGKRWRADADAACHRGRPGIERDG